MVDEASFERHGALTGVGFVVLLVVAVALGGGGVQPSDSAEEVAEYFADKSDALRYAGFIAGLSSVLFLWFLGALGRALRPASARLATIAVASGVAAGAFFGTAIAISAALAMSANRQVDGNTLEFLGSLGGGLVAYASLAAGSLTVAVGLVALRYRAMPRWLAGFSFVAAAALLVGGLQIVSARDTVNAFGYVALGVFLAWVLAVAVTLYREGDAVPGRA